MAFLYKVIRILSNCGTFGPPIRYQMMALIGVPLAIWGWVVAKIRNVRLSTPPPFRALKKGRSHARVHWRRFSTIRRREQLRSNRSVGILSGSLGNRGIQNRRKTDPISPKILIYSAFRGHLVRIDSDVAGCRTGFGVLAVRGFSAKGCSISKPLVHPLTVPGGGYPILNV